MKKNIVIFAGHNLTSFLMIRSLEPWLHRAGLTATIFKTPAATSGKAQRPSLAHYSFYESDLLHLAGNTDHWIEITSLADRRVQDALVDLTFLGALSLRNYLIFPSQFITTVSKRGFLWNLHSGLLPQNQGVFIPFWSLLNENQTHGCSLHEIDQGIDTGRLIDTFETPLDPSKPVIQAYVDLIDGGAAMIIKALETYMAEGSVPAYVQDKSNARYYSFPTEADIARARDKGIRLWGTPLEMLRLYQGLFGADEELTARLVNAIAEFETGADTQGAPDAAAIDNTIVAA